MNQRFKQIPIFKFNEASDELQEKILENYRYFNVEDSFWYDGDWILDYEIFKWSSSKMYFSLDRDQYLQFADLQVNDEKKFQRLLKLDLKTWNKISHSFNHDGKQNTTIEFYDIFGSKIDLDNTYENYLEYCTDWEKSDRLTKKQFEKLARAKEIFDNMIHEAWINLNKDYEYQISDEVIKETLEINGYDFDEFGKIC